MRKISVNGRVIEFEMHPYCGPTMLNKKGDPLKNQPAAFLSAASLWVQQGQRIEDGLCRYDHPPEPILRHMGGKHYQVTGYAKPVKGE